MYKDFKKSQTLDTGFTSGNSLLWMFSGIVLGLLVGLGMYLFSNDKIKGISMIDSLEKKIQKVQTTEKSLNAEQNKTVQKPTPKPVVKKEITEERKNKFSYYAVLPNLDVPVNSAKPINTSSQAQLTPQEAIQPVAEELIEENVVVEANEEVDVVEAVEEIQAPSVGDYMLQVASFKKESMADKTRGRLTNQGVDAYIQKKKIKGHYWYRVVAGPVDQNSVDNWKYEAEKLGHKPLVISVR